MSTVSKGVREATAWLLLGLGALVLVAALQWFAPAHTVQPIGERFTCDGPVEISPAGSAQQGGVFSRVYCVRGVQREDVTDVTLLALAIPAALAVAAGYVLVRKIVVPKQRTQLRRAHA